MSHSIPDEGDAEALEILANDLRYRWLTNPDHVRCVTTNGETYWLLTPPTLPHPASTLAEAIDRAMVRTHAPTPAPGESHA